MIPSSPAKILIGISLDADESKELLHWAIEVLAKPGDTLVSACAMPNKKATDGGKSARKYQRQIRQAKSFVISTVGELVLAGRGLIEEAKSLEADYLIIGKRNRPNRSSCRWSEKNSCTENSFSSEENEISSNMKLKKPSPRTVLDVCEDSSSSGETESCSTVTSLMTTELKGKQESRKLMSPFKLISSFFRPPLFDWSTRKQNDALFNKQKQQPPLLRCFSYQEIARATNNFHIENMVGKGGYSEVYKGEIGKGSSSNSSIAVKRLAKDNSNANKEKEFLVELGIIGHVNHPNTAKLLGFCIDNGLYLIFNFYPNGTLSSALHGQTSKPLDWPIRYRIVLGIARGLHYLHKCCKHRIIHRDIKASNVLLGPDYEPQISDFGLAKWLPCKWTHHAVIPIEGTFGYLAPEYFMHGIVDEKTDVFALGVLLLEIITGRRPVDSTRQNLLLWARPLMECGNLSELADPKLEGRYDMDQLYRVALTASYCVRQSSLWRPSMTEVLQLLTYGQDSEVARSRRIPKFTSEEMDDYSMIFGYDLPSDLALDDI
ncbi:UNVERIFIED_CONTAM: putative receptor-like serine/threonine-protein kinase [Sesamum radiatum]|uniref:Receptor-like serine/threonine-protein kinase n=1 Tax=Sesamum radiatum TaxID=300843 RepID=A0AAW2LEF7_SESRA